MANNSGDDGTLIDEADTTPSEGGSSGGNLATDIGSGSELAEADDPDSHWRVTKQDSIDHAAEVRPDRARAANAGAGDSNEPPNTVG